MASDEELIEATRDIFASLGYELEVDSIDPLLSAQLYVHLCANIFSHRGEFLSKLFAQEMDQPYKLQQIINMIGQELPTIDLSKINGIGIAKGDRSQITAFIGLFNELAHSILEEEENVQNLEGHESSKKQNQEEEYWLMPPKNQQQPVKTRTRPPIQTIQKSKSRAKPKTKGKTVSVSQRLYPGRKQPTGSTYTILQQTKRHYQQYLKEYVKELQVVSHKHQKKQIRAQSAAKRSSKKNATAYKQNASQQNNALQLKIRDEQDHFFKKMSTLALKMQKERKIQQKKQSRKLKHQLDKKINQELTALQQSHINKLSMLKEQIQSAKHAAKVQKIAVTERQRQEQVQQKNIEQRELDQILNLYGRERDRIAMMFEQGGLLQKRFLKMYQKL